MDRSRQAEISITTGMAIVGTAVASGTVVAYLKREVPVTPILVLLAIGLAFITFNARTRGWHQVLCGPS